VFQTKQSTSNINNQHLPRGIDDAVRLETTDNDPTVG